MSPSGIRIELLAPALLAAAPPASNLTETLRFVPGNSVRGAFARRYLELGGDPASESFRRLFLSGEVAFGNALPDGGEVVPLSARTCKYYGGFHADDGHGVVDLLLAGDRDGAQGCPACGESLERPPGYWLPAAGRRAEASTRLITRTAVDPGRGTARTGQLFLQEVLEEGQCFIAAIERPPDLAREIDRLLDGGFEAALGKGGSRGQGWAQIAPAAPPAASWRQGSAAQRCERFRRRAGRPVLALTLVSDGCFLDDYLRAATVPAIEDLAPLGIAPGDWHRRPSRAFADLRRVFGFDGEPLRLPRPYRQAVVAGSTFLFEARGEPRIPAGEGCGWIGEGRREGYGRAVLWHPFHLGAGAGASEDGP